MGSKRYPNLTPLVHTHIHSKGHLVLHDELKDHHKLASEARFHMKIRFLELREGDIIQDCLQMFKKRKYIVIR